MLTRWIYGGNSEMHGKKYGGLFWKTLPYFSPFFNVGNNAAGSRSAFLPGLDNNDGYYYFGPNRRRWWVGHRQQTAIN
jgi:hypothetical protein